MLMRKWIKNVRSWGILPKMNLWAMMWPSDGGGFWAAQCRRRCFSLWPEWGAWLEPEVTLGQENLTVFKKSAGSGTVARVAHLVHGGGDGHHVSSKRDDLNFNMPSQLTMYATPRFRTTYWPLLCALTTTYFVSTFSSQILLTRIFHYAILKSFSDNFTAPAAALSFWVSRRVVWCETSLRRIQQ